ncbi:ankyrin repeat and sam domain containing protein 6 [Colletotrichum kahawae]|uniref:Ankyrin repeat and sam domain containing protein 6 n=1 Tax=Colletotrichum kahawae TaxID=34407 RepID=A0AAD9YA19_COLKA|nr:ankyrin repeat and sam domain containing protein 6 [Colletotrichum kahawae]
MSTTYTPLKASRREIRLISIRADLRQLDGVNTPRGSIPDGTLACTMQTVSLKDWTSEYADFRAKALDWPYPPTTLYEKWERFSSDKTGSMDDDTPTPSRFAWGDYETISYVWDNGSNKTYTIYVNDKPFVIQENLYRALQEFRRSKDFVEDRARMLWADAICINQDDLDERATEVKRMNEIFSTAIKSTVWLGPSLDLNGVDTQVYFDLIDRLIDNLRPPSQIAPRLPAYDSPAAPILLITQPLEESTTTTTDGLQPTSTEHAWSEAESLDEHNPEDHESRALSEEALAVFSQFDPAERPPISATMFPTERLLALLFPIFRLGYWTRVWIIQELTVTSNRTIVRAGSSHISFAQLSWFAEWVFRPTTFGPNWSPDEDYSRVIMNTLLLLNMIYENQLQLKSDQRETRSEYNLIFHGLMSRSCLPLDKLYGVLGLLKPSTYLGIDVDYKKTVRQGSTDAAIALIRAGKRLRSFDIRREFQSSQVPSWAVDLSVDQDPMSSIAVYFQTRRPADIPEVDWDVFWERQVGLSDQGILSLRAKYLDTVDGVAACVPVDSGSLENPSQKLALPRTIDYSMRQSTRLCHSYRDDSEMLAHLDAILRNIPNWGTDRFRNKYYAEGSPDVFKLSTLAVGLELRSSGLPGSNSLGVSAGTATELSSLKQFLDASADFKLWNDELSLIFPEIGQKPGSSISSFQPTESANLLATDDSTALKDKMQHLDLWTLPQVRLATTTSGYLGVASLLARQGDMFYAVEGYGCPVILRPIEHVDTFEFIGLAEIWSPAVSGTWENMVFDSIVRLQ